VYCVEHLGVYFFGSPCILVIRCSREWVECLFDVCPTVCYLFLMTGVDTLAYHDCRAAYPAGQYFTIDECPAGKVINVESAELGYSALYNPNTNPPECPWDNCTRPTDEPAKLCNGRRSCSIRQDVLIYPQGSVPALCDFSKDGNFITIRFTCVIPGTILLVVFDFTLNRCCMYINIL